MAESTLSANLTRLRQIIGTELFGIRAPADLTGDFLTDTDSVIDSGYSQFLVPDVLGEKYAHEWSFLRPIRTLSTSAAYRTGTVTIVNGVVTLTGGTWPTWAVDGDFILNGVTYAVASRDSGTQITLTDLTLDADAGSSYVLGRLAYTLPDDFASLDSPLTYQPGMASLGGPIKQVGEHQIRTWRQWSDVVSRPQVFATRPKASTGVDGQRHQILLYPLADAEYQLSYRSRIHPNKLTSEAPYPLGGMAHSETIIQSCLAVAEQRIKDLQTRHHTDLFLRRLAASISYDRLNNTPDYLGQLGDAEGMGGGIVVPGIIEYEGYDILHD